MHKSWFSNCRLTRIQQKLLTVQEPDQQLTKLAVFSRLQTVVNNNHSTMQQLLSFAIKYFTENKVNNKSVIRYEQQHTSED